MANLGYVRVSTQDQNEDRQLIAMREQGIREQNIFVDKQSGKDFERKAYQALLHRLRPGDAIFLHSLDRLGRDYGEILKQWDIITQGKGADIVVLDMALLDTRVKDRDLTGRLISDIVLQLLSYCAQRERESILKRQAEGIAAAKAKGVRFGRPGLPVPENFGELVRTWEHGKLPLSEVLAQCKLGRSTFYTRLHEFRTAK